MPVSRRQFLETSAYAAAPAAQRPASDRVQVGVVGCGARSQELMRHLMRAGGASITAVTDAYTGRTQRAVERVGKQARIAPDYKDILADRSIDAVIIASPDHWHKQMVLDALAAGKDIYCEKPLTYTVAEGLEILRAVKASNRMLLVGSQGVSSPAQQKAKEWIRQGKLGKVTLIRAAYNRNTASGAWIYPIPPDASPKTVNWPMFLGPAPKRDFSLERFFRWRCYSDYSGGIATDLFVHLCTTIHYLMDAKAPARTMAMGQLLRWKESRDVPDTINAILEYPEGFAVSLSSTFNNQLASESSFQILGTEGSLLLGGDLTFHPETAVEDNRWIVESWPTHLEEAYYRDPKVRAAELPGDARPKLESGVERFRASGYDSTVSHMAAWIESIRTRRPHWEDATIGHRAAACAHMVNQSARTRHLVEWDYSKEDIKT